MKYQGIQSETAVLKNSNRFIARAPHALEL
jgi:hypothetical protein